MSSITLNQIQRAVAAIDGLTPAQQGEALAAIITDLDAAATIATPERNPVRTGRTPKQSAAKKAERREVITAKVAAKPVVTKPKARKAAPKTGNGATIALAANWSGQMMQSDAATITAGQARWLKANTRKSDATIAKLSMVDASNLRAKLTGKA